MTNNGRRQQAQQLSDSKLAAYNFYHWHHQGGINSRSWYKHRTYGFWVRRVTPEEHHHARWYVNVELKDSSIYKEYFPSFRRVLQLFAKFAIQQEVKEK